MYSCASLALLSDDTSVKCIANQIVVPRTSAKIWKKRKLYPVIVRVLKSLNWMVARKIRFSKIYGLSHSTNSMLENAVDVFLQAKNIGLNQSKRVEYLVSLFEEIKKSGPLPNVRSYTIMMNFYCKGHYAVDIGQAAGILEEMESGESPTVVTYSTYIHGLRRIGFVEFALNLIRKLRQKYQPVNSYCYNAVIDGFCKRGEEDES
ncbi:pentatricopeptide repeat-containing protein At5g16640, mitochondrial-like [Camellia sinensis]|uniref:pentatricopeptide repeat-containing protein At5g16640, mitochondrial-like n=1 Tax=Camellia sinensis TaxID=4442 RepID=UPI001035DD05|nr:pentatricopeptide repeat-containing protein At5g16640, mitochondrial-like [Camellia sinensis]